MILEVERLPRHKVPHNDKSSFLNIKKSDLMILVLVEVERNIKNVVELMKGSNLS
jgi:hypothetical protein